MAFLVTGNTGEPEPGGTGAHPLDPLTPAEIEAASEALKAAENLGPMPVHPIGFRLLPSGFFVGNPALDNPAPEHCHHHDG